MRCLTCHVQEALASQRRMFTIFQSCLVRTALSALRECGALWFVFASSFGFVSVGIACHENVSMHHCCLFQPYAESFQYHVVLGIPSCQTTCFCSRSVFWSFYSGHLRTLLPNCSSSAYPTSKYSRVFDKCYSRTVSRVEMYMSIAVMRKLPTVACQHAQRY